MMHRIFDTDKWHEIFATLSRNKTRTFLTAFGIFWGTAMLALLYGGTAGMTGMVTRQFRETATNTGAILASRTTMPYKGYNKGTNWDMTFEDVELARKRSKTMDLSTAVITGFGKIAFNTRNQQARVMGVEDAYFRVQPPIVIAGRLINDHDVYARSKTAILGKSVASTLFGGDGKAAVGQMVNVAGGYYRVVGVVAQRGDISFFGRLDDCVLLPSTVMRLTFNTGNKVEAMMFTTLPGHKPSETLDEIKAACRVHHPIHPDDNKAFWTFDVAEIFEQMTTVFGAINLLGLFVGLGTLLAGVIGVGNIMWIIVRERTQEIGIRRAIGARPSQIIAQVLSESVILTAAAGTAGIVFAVIVLAVADVATADPLLGKAGFVLQFKDAMVILASFLVLGTLAGIVPAIKAMRIKPVEAMRTK